MSLRVSTLVWRATLPSGTQKLVAVRLADFADDDGGRVFPSNARIARDCAISDRAVREAMRALVAINVLILVREEQRWLTAGADVEMCEGVFTAICRTMAERSQAPPLALAFFDQPVADAIATRNRPMPEGKPNEQHRTVQPLRPAVPANRFQRILNRDLAGCAEDT